MTILILKFEYFHSSCMITKIMHLKQMSVKSLDPHANLPESGARNYQSLIKTLTKFSNQP